MPCPWYKDGVCTSPALESPSPDPVIPAICLGDEEVYGKCRYFRKVSKQAAPTYKASKPLLLIHSLSKEPRSGCEFFTVERHESGSFLSVCRVLGRYLTRYEVKLCERYWRDCPFRKLGVRASAEEGQ